MYLVLQKQGKDISVLLTVSVCCMVAISAFRYLETVLNYVKKIQSIGKIDSQIFTTLLRATGIGLLSEIVCAVCNDAGNATLGKVLQFLASVVILWLSLPLFTSLIDLIEEILLSI